MLAAKRIAINGYGRIGRAILRAIVERGLENQLQIVAINDLGIAESVVYETRYDSVHGIFPATVEATDQGGHGDWGAAGGARAEPGPTTARDATGVLEVVLEASRSLAADESDAGTEHEYFYRCLMPPPLFLRVVGGC